MPIYRSSFKSSMISESERVLRPKPFGTTISTEQWEEAEVSSVSADGQWSSVFCGPRRRLWVEGNLRFEKRPKNLRLLLWETRRVLEIQCDSALSLLLGLRSLSETSGMCTGGFLAGRAVSRWPKAAGPRCCHKPRGMLRFKQRWAGHQSFWI